MQWRRLARSGWVPGNTAVEWFLSSETEALFEAVAEAVDERRGVATNGRAEIVVGVLLGLSS